MKRQITDCDKCECEVDESILIPKILNVGKNRVELITEKDICIYCFIASVNELDPRKVKNEK